MDPFNPIVVLLRIGSLNLYTIGILHAVAILISYFFILNKAKKEGIKEEHIFKIFFFIFIGAIVGARLCYIFNNLSSFNSFFDFFRVWGGGTCGSGAYIGAIIVTVLYSVVVKINFYKVMDIFAPWFALIIAFGRVGCFLRGCCFGLPTKLPWGFLYSDNSLAAAAGFAGMYIHPSQLYHSLVSLFIFVVLLKLYKYKLSHKINHGAVFLSFFFLFTIQRIIIDFTRHYESHYYVFGSITRFQIIYLIIFIVSGLLLFNKIKEFRKEKIKKIN